MNSVLKLGKVGGGAIPHENWDDPVEGQFAFQIRVDPHGTRPDSSGHGSPQFQSKIAHIMHAWKSMTGTNSILKLGEGRGGAI